MRCSEASPSNSDKGLTVTRYLPGVFRHSIVSLPPKKLFGNVARLILLRRSVHCPNDSNWVLSLSLHRKLRDSLTFEFSMDCSVLNLMVKVVHHGKYIVVQVHIFVVTNQQVFAVRNLVAIL